MGIRIRVVEIGLSFSVGTTACALAANAWGQGAEAKPGEAASPNQSPEKPGNEAPAQKAASGDDAAAREREEAEIAAAMARNQPPAATGDTASGTSAGNAGSAEASGASASSRGLSNVMNPALSAVGIVVAGATSRPEGAAETPGDLHTGIAVQEVELRASATVDPFFRADVALTGSGEEVAFEEAYITTLEIPRVTIRAGQMHAAFGRHNILHTHAFPFITAPLPWRALLGEEGVSDPGISADVLLPLPFFTEVNAQVFQGNWGVLEGGIEDDPATPVDESVPDLRRDSDLAYVGHLRSLFDLSDSTTVEVGTSYIGGRNGYGGFTNVVGGDLTFKWRPIEAERYTGLDWTTEYLWAERGDAPSDRSRGGGYTALRYQFAQRWWLQARGAVLGVPQSDSGRIWRAEALGAFIPSEFSALRLQYAIEKAENSSDAPIHEVFAQAVFSIGPHPAHAY